MGFISVMASVIPGTGKVWNEQALRSFLPGEGNIPIEEWVRSRQGDRVRWVVVFRALKSQALEWDILDIALRPED